MPIHAIFMSTEAARNSNQKSSVVRRQKLGHFCGGYRVHCPVNNPWPSFRALADGEVLTTGRIIGALAPSMHKSLHILRLASRR